MVQINLFLRGLKAHKRLCSNLRAPDQCPGVTESHPQSLLCGSGKSTEDPGPVRGLLTPCRSLERPLS